ncbi:MAG: hypothetical protein ILP10_03740 [Lachnospiraceae bacterium]|nr:hypothetical protein [Lachnospiraceae bacterium]
MTNATTNELWGKLFGAPQVGTYLDEAGDNLLPEFSEYIKALTLAKGEREEAVIRRGGIESSYGHRLFKGARNPSRDTVLQLAFGLELDSDGTQQLLKVARATALHPRVKRDAVIAFCLYNHKSFMETQELLYDNGLPTIGEKRHDKQ